MPSRKRTRAEMEDPEPLPVKKEPSLLQRIRDMWEFSATMQYIYLFGKVVKIDEDFDIEDFEEECLRPGHSGKLEEIGLTLLKWISSHRGLTFDIWDEYVRRQYLAKAPDRNPYGDDEEPKKFRNFDIFQKIRILHQLTVWTFWNPDRIRERMTEHQKEGEQVEWRMEPFGWDSEEREYYVLDDNRMYRRTEPPLPTIPKKKPKANTIKARAARRRVSKRRRLESEAEDSEAPNDDDSQLDTTQAEDEQKPEDDTYGGYKWECVAITLNDFNDFLESVKKTKDPNEKELRNRIIEDVLPIIEAAAEKQRRKQERRERELMLMEKMAGAKRSSRLADKADREKKEQEEVEASRKKAADLAAAHKEQELQQQMEDERRSRMMTREQRIKDREYKRLLMEEELARDAEEQKRIEEGEKRGSERHIRDRIEKNKKELEELAASEDWTFDCSGCGKHGKNFDDGSHSIACERCNVWQHSKCLGISKAAAESDDFHFICDDCHKKEEEAKRPKIMLKFGNSGQSSPPQASGTLHRQSQSSQAVRLVSVDVPKAPVMPQPIHRPVMDGLAPVQSPISRPTAASPNTQIQAGGTEQKTGPPSPTQSRKVPIHTSSSPPAQSPSAPHIDQSRPHQHSANGNSFHQYSRPLQPSMPTSSQANSYQGQGRYNPVQSTPRQTSTQGMANGPSPAPHRLPSPVINRPTMSPTQGNPDVGPIAGVPGSSPSAYHPALFTPNANGSSSGPSSQEQQMNGHQSGRFSSSPRQSFVAQSPNPQHLSGLSPVKQRVNSPLPTASNALDRSFPTGMSPPASNTNAHSFHNNSNSTLRSVSGTPIFPPAEKLAPSPEHVHRDPVPTPSKPASPPMAGGEFGRISGGDLMQGVQVNGHVNGQPQHSNSVTPSQSQAQVQAQTAPDQGGQRQQS